MNFKNEYFDSATCEFEVLGFYEDLMDAVTRKYLGHRPVDAPTRPMGAAGESEYDLVEDTYVRRGANTFLVKASVKRPRRVIGMLQVLCGRTKIRGNEGHSLIVDDPFKD